MSAVDCISSAGEPQARSITGCTVLLCVLLLGCSEPAPPPEHHRVELPGHGTLIVDIEMVDTWEKTYRSVFRFEPRDGGPVERVVERHRSRSLPRVVLAEEEPELNFEKPNHELLAILANDQILLRLPQQRLGSESLLVRTAPGEWQRYDFADDELEEFAAWQADLRPYDAQHTGYSELLHVDVPRREFTYYRHGGYLTRELTFRLAPNGRSIELTKLRRAPRESRSLGTFDPAWASAALIERAREIFLSAEQAPGWRLDDARITEFQDCPATGHPDRLRVLFIHRRDAASPADSDSALYRTALWRFESRDGDWALAAIELQNPSSSAILDLSHATYDEVRNCVKVY